MRMVSVALLAAAATACAGAPPGGHQDIDPPRRPLGMVTSADFANPLVVHDPAEIVNRSLYKFNAQADEYVLLPIVDLYRTVTPEFLRQRVSSFFLNLSEIGTFANSVLQASPQKAVPTAARFVINSLAGIFGLFDVATPLGIRRQDEDFGQTLGYWGVGDGPYIVLPLLGPSNLRDTVGRVGDILTLSLIVPGGLSDEPLYQAVQYGLRPVDTRYRIPFRYHMTGSPFEYGLVRYVYTESRRIQIAD